MSWKFAVHAKRPCNTSMLGKLCYCKKEMTSLWLARIAKFAKTMIDMSVHVVSLKTCIGMLQGNIMRIVLFLFYDDAGQLYNGWQDFPDNFLKSYIASAYSV